MNKISTFSNFVVKKIANTCNTILEDDDLEIYQYGFECLIESVIVYSILILWGFFTGEFFSIILWITIFCILRHYAGGLHAPNPYSCIITSIAIGISSFYAPLYLPSILLSPNNYIFLFGLPIYFMFFSPLVNYEKKFSKKNIYIDKIIITAICFFLLSMLSLIPKKYAYVSIHAIGSVFILHILELIKRVIKHFTFVFLEDKT